jgi:hypothetical protein
MLGTNIVHQFLLLFEHALAHLERLRVGRNESGSCKPRKYYRHHDATLKSHLALPR